MGLALVKKTYARTYPVEITGAVMRIVLPGKKEVAFVPNYEHIFEENDDFPVSFGLSFPCHKKYNFETGPVGFHECSGGESFDHGHILIMGDDGIAMLPHVITSKADVLQALQDVETNKTLDVYLGDTAGWMEVLHFIAEHDPVITTLPEKGVTPPVSYDLSKLGWWF